MARIDWVEARLVEWACWAKGGNATGYSAMSPLHQDWMPPAPGTTPTLKTAPASSRARETHRQLLQAIEQGVLSARQADTLVVVYVMAVPVADQVLRLGCQADTIGARVRAIHALLAGVLRN